jgi:ElaB/YqjD/DUF883 family membrane-anchored ribosome-binding protein
MEEKRASLADKLDTLENHVLGTVQEATEAVSHTVEDVKSVVDTVTENVKETVENVTETVKHTFDVRDHVRHHPWGMFCGAIAAGFLGGQLLGPARSEQRKLTTEGLAPTTPPEPVPLERAARREEPVSGMSELLGRVKGLALGAVMKTVRDLLAETLPETMKEDVISVVDEFTTKLGGKPIPASANGGHNGAHPSLAREEQTQEERPQTRGQESRQTGESEPRSGGGKKGQPSGGRFDRRNPPPQR